MKQITFVLIVLLLVIQYAYADGSPVTREDHWEKVRQLDQLAERFKAETGFTGEVEHSTTSMRLYLYQGNFPGISFTADGDTIAFRQACEGIISKVLPYSRAASIQLSMSRISKGGRGYTTKYYQQVNGCRVEGVGYIMITYDDGRKYFLIGDNAVELPEEEGVSIITEEEAEQIALRDMNDKRYSISKEYNLFYSKEGSDSYYLAYFVGVFSITGVDDDDYAYWIDAKTGYIHKKCVAPRY